MPILGLLKCVPARPTIGETALIEVHPPVGITAFDAATSHSIRINGVPCFRRYVQFIRPGLNTVWAQAYGPGGPESQSLAIQILQPTNPPAAITSGLPALLSSSAVVAPHVWPEIGVPLLQTAHLPQQPNVVAFGIGSSSGLALRTESIFNRSLRVLPEMLLPNLGQSFDISVQSAGQTVTRTLTFTNLYAMLKRIRGEAHPTLTPVGFARRVGSGFKGHFTIYNSEARPLVIVRCRFDALSVDGQTLSGTSGGIIISQLIVVPPRHIHFAVVFASFDNVAKDSNGFGAHFTGRVAGSDDMTNPITVRANVQFDLEPGQRSHLSSLAHSLDAEAHLNTIASALATLNRSGASLSELRSARLVSLPILEDTRSVVSMGTRAALSNGNLGDVHFDSAVMPPTLTVGAECDPDNLPGNTPEGLVCQANSETRIITSPGRFMNARKRDVILSPGGNGLIGGLLTHVNHPQYYSHSGIMTRNYDQITHRTASQERLEAYPVGSIPFDGPEPTDDFRPGVVKYDWPGVITQNVEDAVDGQVFTDPDDPNHRPYTIQAFDAVAAGATVQGNWHIIPPIVIKPDPMQETMKLREKLHEVAGNAADSVGTLHYRFYGYSDPKIVKTAAPADSRWAANTNPAICSSFIWAMMKETGMLLQTAGNVVTNADLRGSAVSAGDKVGPSTPDGLFLYSAAERKRCAEWLHEQIANRAMDKINQKAGILGGVVDLFTKLTTHVSNEFLNPFARDVVGTDDDDTACENTVDANAVSPDNIMCWKGHGGTSAGPYGCWEPLIYREPSYDVVRINRWRQVQLTVHLFGVITFQAQPLSGVTVTLYEGKVGNTDAAGHYTIHQVPHGMYTAKAHKVQDGNVLSVATPVTLMPPPPRKILIWRDHRICSGLS
ncbi:hypothetical protein B0A48_18349 [Cryoendolithus antarcticus]|uniref:Carboxypeptidase regulatory-like domain-containing protein n=1 Tax=Cryoendolithus antarcticus TaxID=1507870 RepID=A0A1V8SAK8_9PEZI|nr:hypothetical protein B0A48_18349 [Cryoendolithus antarcticus]